MGDVPEQRAEEPAARSSVHTLSMATADRDAIRHGSDHRRAVYRRQGPGKPRRIEIADDQHKRNADEHEAGPSVEDPA